MRLTTWVWASALPWAVFGAAAVAAVAPDLLPQPIATRQDLFSIPFRLDQASAGVTEVELYVSLDRGATWRFYSTAEPARGSFLFRAPGDGQYWFSIRSVAAVRRPAQDLRPGLRVIVDTVPPKLQLRAERGQGGEIVVEWSIEEPNLDPDRLSIQYRTGPYQPWQSVAMDRARQAARSGATSGQVTWWPQATFERMEIRGEAADRAGNTAVSHAQLGARTSPPTAANPHAAGPQGAAPSPAPADPFLRQRPQAASPPEAEPATVRIADGPKDAAPASPDSPSARSIIQRPADPATTTAGPPASGAPGEGGVSIQINPAIGSRHVAPNPADGTSPLRLPPGVHPRMVNSRRFQLEYDVESVGPSGIAQVELWGTRDGGQTWKSYGLDEDKRSPIVATANEEGLFGFRIAVRSGAGLGGDPPKPGDQPDIWIGVDLTKPACRILSAEQMTGEQAGQLLVRWEASDMLLAEKPVTLLYSPGRDGPWVPFASGLENTGQHAWKVEGRVPARIYLRLEVRDEAGNLGIFETREPISLDQFRPSVRIKQVRPA